MGNCFHLVISSWVENMARIKSTALKATGGQPTVSVATAWKVAAARVAARKAGGKEPQGQKKKYRPGTVSLWEIRRYQKTTFNQESCLWSFGLRDSGWCKAKKWTSLRVSPDAVNTLQEAAEAYLVLLFEDTNFCAIHAKHITIQLKDI